MKSSGICIIKKAYIKKVAAGMLAVFFIAISFEGCGGNGGYVQPKKKAPLVRTETVVIGRIQHSIDLTGEVVSVESIQVSATVEGPIAYCPWREGDRVEPGRKLIEIDREMYRAEVKAAEAALAVAEAKLADLKAGTRPEEIEKARQSVREAEQSAAYEQADFERIEQLVVSGALPGEDLDKARVKLTAAEAKLNAARQQFEMLESGFTRTAIAVQQAVVKEAEAKLLLAKARMNECVIVAPFAGTITRIFVRQGDMAAMKAPLLQMADLNSLVFRCAVPEIQAGSVTRGMKAEVRLDAIPGKTFSAETTRVFPELDPRMRTRTVELKIQGEADLAPGMFGRVRLIVDSTDDAVTVPVQSILVTPIGDQIVFAAIDGKAVKRNVQTGIEENGRIQILSGLKPGENIIVAGHEKLKDGSEIRLPVGSPGNGKDVGKLVGKEEGSR